MGITDSNASTKTCASSPQFFPFHQTGIFYYMVLNDCYIKYRIHHITTTNNSFYISYWYSQMLVLKVKDFCRKTKQNTQTLNK